MEDVYEKLIKREKDMLTNNMARAVFLNQAASNQANKTRRATMRRLAKEISEHQLRMSKMLRRK